MDIKNKSFLELQADLQPMIVWHTNIGVGRDQSQLDLSYRKPQFDLNGNLWYLDRVSFLEEPGKFVERSLEEYSCSVRKEDYLLSWGCIPFHAIIQVRYLEIQ